MTQEPQMPVLIPQDAHVFLTFPDAEYVLKVLNSTPAPPREVFPILMRIQQERDGLVEAVRAGKPTFEQQLNYYKAENLLLKQAVAGSTLDVNFVTVALDLAPTPEVAKTWAPIAEGLNAFIKTSRDAAKVSVPPDDLSTPG